MAIRCRATVSFVKATRQSRGFAKWLLVLATSVIAAGCHPPLAPPTAQPSFSTRVSLPVTLHPQEAWQWCWAASAQMITSYLGHPVSQCSQASKKFAPPTCSCTGCTSATPIQPECDKTGWPDFEGHGFRATRTSRAALSWQDLTKQLCTHGGCKKTPFAFTWEWEGGGGHMMVAKGYAISRGGKRYVEVLDPLAPGGPCHGSESIIPYDAYRELPGDHTHWDDFYDIAYKGG
jgi:hypothetical protein